MSTEKSKLEACARAGYETIRAYDIAIGRKTQPWDKAAKKAQQDAMNITSECLRGARPSPELWKEGDAKRYVMFIGAVRTVASALGMTVTYPATINAPEHTVDFSQEPEVYNFDPMSPPAPAAGIVPPKPAQAPDAPKA